MLAIIQQHLAQITMHQALIVRSSETVRPTIPGGPQAGLAISKHSLIMADTGV